MAGEAIKCRYLGVTTPTPGMEATCTMARRRQMFGVDGETIVVRRGPDVPAKLSERARRIALWKHCDDEHNLRLVPGPARLRGEGKLR